VVVFEPAARSRDVANSRAPLSDLVELNLASNLRCPPCRDGFVSGDNLIVCPECRTIFHRECLGKVGACTTFGCANGVPVPPLPRRRRNRRLVVLAATLLLAGGGVAAAAWSVEPEGCTFPVRRPPVKRVVTCCVPPVLPPLTPVVAPVVTPQVLCYETPAVPQIRRCVPRAPSIGLRVPTQAKSSEILITGTITGDGPLRIEVKAPSGNVGWDAFEPGPFVTGVTLLAPGRHEITVTVTDCTGHAVVKTYVVNRV
jgi:hypothetical protein